MNTKIYDYIICGAGCAGLSLAIRLADPFFSNKSILIIDKSLKNTNDRTWSFWADPKIDRFASIYKHSWSKIALYAPGFEQVSNPDPYTYNTIRGIDFYNHAKEIIASAGHIEWIKADISDVRDQGDHVIVSTTKEVFQASFVFDSVVRSFPEESKLFVWQHFLGWEVTLDHDHFDEDQATFMDFRMDQAGETRFVYVLPFSPRKALVEVTFFSKKIVEDDVYVDLLETYMDKYVSSNYTIKATEKGAIPMTTEPFSKGSQRVIPIGTNNGTVKPSSGYAFTRIQNESDLLLDRIKEGKIRKVKPSQKFLAYDRTLLNVLITKKESGAKVFTTMFKRNPAERNFKFLNEETSLTEEVQIFWTLPKWPFLKAFIQENVLLFTK